MIEKYILFFFFFQAEDGILYRTVTGVQTCALPILPPLLNFAHAHALNPLVIGMIWTFAVGGKIFIYQSAVLVVGYSYGYFDARDMLRVGALLTIAQLIILVVLVPLYW